MKRRINTKTCLISAILALVLVAGALLGTTFAWFTDSVTSSFNQIKSGKLDVGMNYWDSASGKFLNAENVPLFDENALWEPGCIQVAYLEIENRGSLAFNYLFAVYPAEETEGYLANGEKFWLSNYLTFAIVAPYDVEEKGEIKTREDALKLLEGTEMGLNERNMQVGELYPSNTSKASTTRLALVIYMPTEVTSEQANHDLSSGKPLPSVKLAVDVYATQRAEEFDSIDNQYDSGLTPIWAGPIWRYAPDGYEVDEVNKTLTVNNVEALKELGSVLEMMKAHPKYEPSEWEIILGADMDFAGETLTEPLQINGFKKLNGNNKTITNVILNYIYIDEQIESVGLFDALPDTENLTVTNVSVTSSTTAAGVLAGTLTGTKYNNISISDSSASGVGFIGGMIGFGNFLLPIDFSYIEIFRTDLFSYDGRSAMAGGLAGSASGSSIKITDSEINGLDTSGVRAPASQVGGMFGELNADALIEESTVTEITIYKDVYVGSITGKIYDERIVSVKNTTVAVQASNGAGYSVIPLTGAGDVTESDIEVDALGFPKSALHGFYNGHYYQVVQGTYDWFTARDLCTAMNGHLATVTSAAENAELARIVTNHGGSTWLGAERSAEDYNKFVWITGEEMTYEYWDSGEPNDLNGEQCVHMYASSGKWNDFDYYSTSASAYACEWDSLQAYLNFLTNAS